LRSSGHLRVGRRRPHPGRERAGGLLRRLPVDVPADRAGPAGGVRSGSLGGVMAARQVRGRLPPPAPLGAEHMTDTPPLDRWEEEGAIQELERLAAELPQVGADQAWERLERLTETQRAAIENVLKLVDQGRG